jgi:hypothetical protein
MTNRIDFKKVNNDINGNPRYVCHFFNLINDKESKGLNVLEKYSLALMKAKKLGGKKYDNKQYGGGIVFGSVYNVNDLEKKIISLLTN